MASPEFINVSIALIDRLSQAVRRIARTANVRCLFYTPSTLRSAYHIKDSTPATMLTHNVYSVKCQTCDAEYVGETKRAIAVRKKEHQDAIRLGQTLKSAIAEHAHEHSPIHEIDW